MKRLLLACVLIGCLSPVDRGEPDDWPLNPGERVIATDADVDFVSTSSYNHPPIVSGSIVTVVSDDLTGRGRNVKVLVTPQQFVQPWIIDAPSGDSVVEVSRFRLLPVP